MRGDPTKVIAEERIVVHKYDGNLTEEEMETAEPVETVVLVNGKIVEVIRREDNN